MSTPPVVPLLAPAIDIVFAVGSPSGPVVFVRYPPARVAGHCGRLDPVSTISNPWDIENEVADAPILVCRNLQTGPEDLRDDLRHYE